jgi:hypothetical protein
MSKINHYKEALYGILDSHRLDVAKEIAADVLGECLEEYLHSDIEELDFEDEDTELDYSLLDNDED